MNILHISDIHFCQSYAEAEKGYDGMIAKMGNPLTHVAASLAHAKQQMPIDLLVISGDLTEEGTVEDYRYLKNWFYEQIGETPMIVTLGNHDHKGNFRVGWLEEERSEAAYNAILSFESVHIVSFDSSVQGNADGQMTDRQFDWLGEQLEALNDKPIILVTHHHLVAHQASTPPLPESARLLEVMNNYSILALFNGHTHHAYTGDLAGTQYYTAGGMSFVGEDEGQGQVRFEERYGYNIYRLAAGRIIQQTTENFVTGRVIARVNMLDE